MSNIATRRRGDLRFVWRRTWDESKIWREADKHLIVDTDDENWYWWLSGGREFGGMAETRETAFMAAEAYWEQYTKGAEMADNKRAELPDQETPDVDEGTPNYRIEQVFRDGGLTWESTRLDREKRWWATTDPLADEVADLQVQAIVDGEWRWKVTIRESGMQGYTDIEPNKMAAMEKAETVARDSLKERALRRAAREEAPWHEDAGPEPEPEEAEPWYAGLDPEAPWPSPPRPLTDTIAGFWSHVNLEERPFGEAGIDDQPDPTRLTGQGLREMRPRISKLRRMSLTLLEDIEDFLTNHFGEYRRDERDVDMIAAPGFETRARRFVLSARDELAALHLFLCGELDRQHTNYTRSLNGADTYLWAPEFERSPTHPSIVEEGE